MSLLYRNNITMLVCDMAGTIIKKTILFICNGKFFKNVVIQLQQKAGWI